MTVSRARSRKCAAKIRVAPRRVRSSSEARALSIAFSKTTRPGVSAPSIAAQRRSPSWRAASAAARRTTFDSSPSRAMIPAIDALVPTRDSAEHAANRTSGDG